MKLGKYSILIFLIIGTLAWWGSRMISSGESGLPPLHTIQTDRGDVSQRIVAHGTLQPIHKVTVGSQVSGIIEEIRVDFNSYVSQGDIIALIDPSTFEAAVSSAQAELESAESGLETSASASGPDSITGGNDRGEGQVYVLRNGEIKAARVRTGLSDGVNTEIRSGLSAGDTLVVGLSLNTTNETGRRSLFSGQVGNTCLTEGMSGK
ncbi:MAG: biotin/lipoyl-binding protein [Balneolales bacterium]